MSAVYRRILLKLSGEALAGEAGFGIDPAILDSLADEIATVAESGVQLGIVVGGGNFFRGMSEAAADMDRINADYIGMLATVMNALAIKQALDRRGAPTRVQSALPVPSVAEPYVRARALKNLDQGRLVVFAAGTGNPLFTTDSAASLRAIEINADIMLKATKVDGVYDDDPATNSNARRYKTLSFDDVMAGNLRVMDATAITLCRDHDMAIRVFSIRERGSLARVVAGEDVGTTISSDLPAALA